MSMEQGRKLVFGDTSVLDGRPKAGTIGEQRTRLVYAQEELTRLEEYHRGRGNVPRHDLDRMKELRKQIGK